MRITIYLFNIGMLFSTTVFGQRGLWPPNYRADELLNSPSARASGMGETGVSHVHEKSF